MVSHSTINQKITCTVCGFSFSEGAKTSCANCPLHGQNCGFVKCPNCGFDIPVSSKIWEWMMKIKDKLQGDTSHGRKDSTH
ncbi:MAG: hypothetical protein HUU50_16200 [Candidatus Brocadiae bacterium]|nr:hypothetical protein [Candidatus Brocadiia bacterium]